MGKSSRSRYLVLLIYERPPLGRYGQKESCKVGARAINYSKEPQAVVTGPFGFDEYGNTAVLSDLAAENNALVSDIKNFKL